MHTERLLTGRPPALWAAVALLLVLPGCQTITLPPSHSEAGIPPHEIARYADAHQRSVFLRTNLGELSRIVRQQLLEGGFAAPETLERIRDSRREYFALRETLFEIAFLHASAIVQVPTPENLYSVLLRSSLALLAGTDLVDNFHAAAGALSDVPVLPEVWNEADPAHGIPAGGWKISLQSYRNTRYLDLFKLAIERLEENRRGLEGFRKEGDPNLLALYPHGVAATLRQAEQSYLLARARLALEDLGQDEREVRALVERSASQRSGWAASAPPLRQAIERDGGLIRGRVHVQVQTAKREFLDLREALYRMAFKHAEKLTRPDIPYPRDFRLRAIGISLLAAIALYENARLVETQFLTIPGVRDLLNQGDPALGIRPGFWDNIEREFVRVEYRNLLEAGIQAMEQEQALADTSRTVDDPFLVYVSQQILASAALHEIRGEDTNIRIGRALRYYAKQVAGLWEGTLKGGGLAFSKGFGNLMGAFEFRKGKLFGQGDWVQFLRERLQPGDLLLEKTPFRLTDKFIPGHFGHVALYVGTEAELRELGLHTHPWVIPHLVQVAQGRMIVEALRDGTQINTFEHFLNIDDLAILRPKQARIPDADVVLAIALAFSHIGKQYDFAFDSNTWDSIVCSELAFQTYVNVPWAIGKVLHSYTIAPDDVASLGGLDPSQPFELIAFIHDGRVVHDKATGLQQETLYSQLLGRRLAHAADVQQAWQ